MDQKKGKQRIAILKIVTVYPIEEKSLFVSPERAK